MKIRCFKDKNKRKNLLISESLNLIYKSISKNNKLKHSFRFNSDLKLNSHFSTLNSKVSVVNRCIVSGRKSTVMKNLKFSRIYLLKICRKGLIPGVRKSSW